MGKESGIEEKNFVEEVGIVFEQTGLPRMAGRIFGWLLTCDPPHQTTGEIVQALLASKGSISTMTRLLIRIGLIEKLSLPGVRQEYFRLRADAWRHLIRHGLNDEICMFRQLAERGMALPADKLPQARKWLEGICDVYSFLEREFPILVERWEKEHEESKLKAK